jgi:high-affinity iron transporter
MLPTATIVFREFLEIALVISLVMAATQGLPGRARLILTGLGLGFLGAGVIAFFTDTLAASVHGTGQDIFNAGVLFVAVGFLSWTVIWMKHHAKHLSHHIRKVGSEIVAGEKSQWVLVTVVALASLREGAEIVLFTYGMVASGQFTWSSILAGAALGAVAGIVVGSMLYLGLLKTARRHLLAVTSWLLILLTAGMAAQGASYLIAAGLLPDLIPQMWDTSNFISGKGLLGETLGVLIGYTPRPSGMEVLFYIAVVALIALFMYRPWQRTAPGGAKSLNA